MQLVYLWKREEDKNFTVYMYVQPNQHAIHQISRQADTKTQNNDHLNSKFLNFQ